MYQAPLSFIDWYTTGCLTTIAITIRDKTCKIEFYKMQVESYECNLRDMEAQADGFATRFALYDALKLTEVTIDFESEEFKDILGHVS